MRKRWIIVMAITVVLAGVITGGAVMAQEGGSAEKEARQSFASRVASILKLEESVVQDALSEARKDMQNEGYQKRLDQMVEKGRLTQGQADQQYNWFESRPDTAAGFHSRPRHGGALSGHGRFGRGMGGWQGSSFQAAPPSTNGTTY